MTRAARRLLTVCAVVVLGAACGQGSAGGNGGTTTRSPQPGAGHPVASPSPTTSVTPAGSVFVIVMENRTYAEAMEQPYTASLASQFAVATSYYAVSHPSLPNYLALTSGSTWGIKDDDYHSLSEGGIGHQLTQQGVSWRAYMESMTAGCRDSPSPYAVKHNPFAYYGGACPSNVVPLTALEGDLTGSTPRFVWITPNLCNDGHDCSSQVADAFLRGLVPKILASGAWRSGGVLFLTWDESDGGSDNRVPLIVASKDLTVHSTSHRHDHYSLLATVEDRLGVARLGAAQQADPLSELFA
jgi:phosphatidylinositol-3-phosphatase